VSDFIETLNFLDRFSKNTQISNFVKKNLPVGAELFHAEGQTDRETGRYDEANGSFSQNCERANKMFAWFGESNEPNATPDRPLALGIRGRSSFCDCKPKGEFLRTTEQDGGRTQKSLAK